MIKSNSIEPLGVLEMSSNMWESAGSSASRLSSAVLKKAGLLWDVKRCDIPYKLVRMSPDIYGQPTFLAPEVKEDLASRPPYKSLLVRDDTGVIIGDCGARYKIITNKEMFTIVENLRQEELLEVEAVGSLRDGGNVWVLCSLPTKFEVVGEDWVQPYLVFYNSHDGLSTAGAGIVDVRISTSTVVQVNTLKGVRSVGWKSFDTLEEREATTKEMIKTEVEEYEERSSVFERMASKTLTEETFRSVVQECFGRLYSNPLISRLEEIRGEIDEDFGSSTVWNAHNSICEYLCYERSGDGEEAARQRLEAVFYGDSSRIISKSLEEFRRVK